MPASAPIATVPAPAPAAAVLTAAGPLNLRAAAAVLAAAGVPSPRHDAELLAAFVLGTSRSRLPLAAPATPTKAAAFAELVARRARREPLQHLTGRAPFRDLMLAVGPGVFIPRPETEGLVDLVLAEIDRAQVGRAEADPAGAGCRVLDLCAGSGAIALSVAAERPGTAVYAVESDPSAFGWLTRNLASVPVSPAVSATHGTVSAAPSMLRGTFDIVVSNPPYLLLGTVADPEVADFDPPAALWGGTDGLEVLREVIAAAAQLLRAGGLLAVEHDATHQPELLAALTAAGFTEVTGHRDLAGRDRYATARVATARIATTRGPA